MMSQTTLCIRYGDAVIVNKPVVVEDCAAIVVDGDTVAVNPSAVAGCVVTEIQVVCVNGKRSRSRAILVQHQFHRHHLGSQSRRYNPVLAGTVICYIHILIDVMILFCGKRYPKSPRAVVSIQITNSHRLCLSLVEMKLGLP